MLYFLNNISKSRKFWLILTFSAYGLITIAWYIQYFFLLKPCILCIYQRCALFGIAIAGTITTIYPNTFLRFIGIFIWFFSASKGFFLAKKNIYEILHPSPFSTCDLFVVFPSWLSLNKWWPNMFGSIGNSCLDYKWYFLSLELSQWMLLIFANYMILASYTMIALFIFFKK